MTLWMILTVLTSLAAVLVAAPFLRRMEETQVTSQATLAVYRDQISEVDRDRRDELISEEEARLARLEIDRRILAVAEATTAGPKGLSVSWRGRAMAMTAGSVVLGAVALYAVTGRPDLPAAVAAVSGPAPVTTAMPAREADPDPVEALRQQTERQVGPVDEMIARLAARLESRPEDGEGWRMLGWSYFNTQKYGEAARAYARAAALKPDDAGVQAAHGEALVRAAAGRVTPDALKAFDRAVSLDPDEPRARFFKGLAKEQAGNAGEALEDWIALLNGAPEGADWAGDLRARIVELAGRTGIDVADRLPAQASRPEPPGLPVITGGPSQADIRDAQQMSAADRQAMIRGMVDRLAKRLQADPDDPDGWIKLIRSRVVLREPDKARQTAAQALRTFADKPQTRTRIRDAARQLGVAVD